MDSVAVVGVLLVGALLGYLVAKKIISAGQISRAELEQLAANFAASESVKQELARQLEELKAQQLSLQGELRVSRERAVALETEKQALARQIEQRAEDLKQLEHRFRLEFENTANKIFHDKSEIFKKQSQESIGELLAPLKDKLGEFQKKVDDSFGNQAKEQFALKSEIERIVKVNEKMSLEAENLTRALKGDVQAQGNWGEVILEKILEESGLRRDEDYTVQGEELGLRHVESGGRLKPDVIVHLPDDKHVIIDSKVSLVHYEQYASAVDEVAKIAALKQFSNSVKSHVLGLEKRRYQDVEKLGTPDFVLMFMPIEGAYSLAVQSDKDLHTFAWDKRIVIVCPSTLFATLRTIASIWKIERQNKNSEKIAQMGGALYDKIAAFVGDMERLGNQIETVRGSYEGAMKKLSTGKGNVITRTEQLRDFGVKATKKIALSGDELIEDSSSEQ